jgi:hypothetical protein
MGKKNPTVVKEAAQMRPRIVFDFDGKATVKECLTEPGVYVRFRDDVPYYVCKTDKKLFRRIRAHATMTRDRYYHFWNYFSAFVVPNAKHRDEVEGVLIASMPTANGAIPRIKRIPIPKNVNQLMHKMRKGPVSFREPGILGPTSGQTRGSRNLLNFQLRETRPTRGLRNNIGALCAIFISLVAIA